MIDERKKIQNFCNFQRLKDALELSVTIMRLLTITKRIIFQSVKMILSRDVHYVVSPFDNHQAWYFHYIKSKGGMMAARNAICVIAAVTLLPQVSYRALIIKFLKKCRSTRRTAAYRNSMLISRSNYDNRGVEFRWVRLRLVILRECYKSEHSDISDRGPSIYQLRRGRGNWTLRECRQSLGTFNRSSSMSRLALMDICDRRVYAYKSITTMQTALKAS